MMNRFRLGSFFISIVLVSMVSTIYSSCSSRISQVKTEETAALEVNDVRLSDNPDKTEVIVSGSGHIPYTTFRLTDPPRLILDLAGTSLGNFKEKIEVMGGEVVSIIPKEGEKPNMVSRLEIVLAGLAESNVRRDGDSLVVEILKTPAIAEEARDGGGIPEEAKAEIKGPEPQIAEEKVLPPARNISKIDIDKSEKGIKVTVTGDGEMKPNTFIVGERRLVFDIPDTTSQVKPANIQVDHPILKRIRIGQHKDPEKVRIVLDLNKLTPYIVDKKGDQFIVFLGESIPTKVTIEERPEEAGKEAPKVADVPLPDTKPTEIIPVAKE
ncbi:MAG: AMIN domain-containing protein, partial [Nitrospirota bacterium]